MKQGFSLLEILVALALFGLLSALTFASLTGLFRLDRKGSLEGRAAFVAQDYWEKALAEASYNPSARTLTLPRVPDPKGFTVTLKAGGRFPGGEVTLADCAGTARGWTCPVECIQQGAPLSCPLLVAGLFLHQEGRTYAFYREWRP